MAAVFAAAIFICYYAGVPATLAAGGAGTLLVFGAGGLLSAPGSAGAQSAPDSVGTSSAPSSAGSSSASGKHGFVWLLLFCYILSVLNFWMTENRNYELVSHAEETVTLVGEVDERQNRLTSAGESYIQLEVSVEQLVSDEPSTGQIVPDASGESFAEERSWDQSTGSTPEAQTLKHPEKILIRIYDNPDFDGVPGQYICAKGELRIPDTRRNPGCFDYRLYLKSLDIRTTMTARSIRVVTGKEYLEITGRSFCISRISARMKTVLYHVKTGFVAGLRATTGPTAASMMEAILFGDKGGLEEETVETFQRNGTAHILAVSGLHIGIIYAFLLRVWNLIGTLTGGRLCARRGWSFFLIMGTFFWCYMIMASFSPSVVRAVIMILLHMIAQITNRRYDLSCAAFAVFLAVLADCPFMLFNTGFQMSFLAVLTMGLILPYIHHFYSGMLAASVAVQLGLGPFVAYTFNYLSAAAVLVNIPVIFLAGIMVPMGVCGMALSAAGFPSSLLCKSLGGLCEMLTSLNDWVEVEGVTTFIVTSPSLVLIGFYYLGLLLLASEEGRMALFRAVRNETCKSHVRTSASHVRLAASQVRLAASPARTAVSYVLRTLAIAAALAVAFAWMAGDEFKKADMVFVDVGQGDCMHLRVDSTGALGALGLPLPESKLFSRHGYNVLIDGGGSADYDVGKKTLRPYLLKNGVRKVDLAIVTHLHTDHYEGIRSLCRMGMVDKLCVYEGYKVNESEILEECGLDTSDLIYVTAGKQLQVGSATFEFLAPPARSDAEYIQMASDEEDENNKSLLIKIEYQGVSALMTGDISAEGEAAVLERYQQNGSTNTDAGNILHCDILKVGHHGSKYSTSESFLAAVAPSVAVIQVGARNMYGHPTPEVLERLDSFAIPVWRNDWNGAIGIDLCKGHVKEVMTMIKP